MPSEQSREKVVLSRSSQEKSVAHLGYWVVLRDEKRGLNVTLLFSTFMQVCIFYIVQQIYIQIWYIYG